MEIQVLGNLDRYEYTAEELKESGEKLLESIINEWKWNEF
jgi:hypothetical protein